MKYLLIALLALTSVAHANNDAGKSLNREKVTQLQLVASNLTQFFFLAKSIDDKHPNTDKTEEDPIDLSFTSVKVSTDDRLLFLFGLTAPFPMVTKDECAKQKMKFLEKFTPEKLAGLISMTFPLQLQPEQTASIAANASYEITMIAKENSELAVTCY